MTRFALRCHCPHNCVFCVPLLFINHVIFFFQTDQRQQDRVHQARHFLRTCISQPSVSFYLYILFFSYSQMKTSESFPGKLDF